LSNALVHTSQCGFTRLLQPPSGSERVTWDQCQSLARALDKSSRSEEITSVKAVGQRCSPPSHSTLSCNRLLYRPGTDSRYHSMRSDRLFWKKKGRPILEEILYDLLDREPRVRTVTGIAMESRQIDVTLDRKEAYFGQLHESISGVPCYFVFNMNEIPNQPCADRPPVECYLPATTGVIRCTSQYHAWPKGLRYLFVFRSMEVILSLA
jgi:hypothetical protein